MKSFKDAVGKCEKKEYVEYVIDYIECGYGEENDIKRQFELEGKEIVNIEYLDKVIITYKIQI